MDAGPRNPTFFVNSTGDHRKSGTPGAQRITANVLERMKRVKCCVILAAPCGNGG